MFRVTRLGGRPPLASRPLTLKRRGRCPSSPPVRPWVPAFAGMTGGCVNEVWADVVCGWVVMVMSRLGGRHPLVFPLREGEERDCVVLSYVFDEGGGQVTDLPLPYVLSPSRPPLGSAFAGMAERCGNGKVSWDDVCSAWDIGGSERAVPGEGAGDRRDGVILNRRLHLMSRCRRLFGFS